MTNGNHRKTADGTGMRSSMTRILLLVLSAGAIGMAGADGMSVRRPRVGLADCCATNTVFSAPWACVDAVFSRGAIPLVLPRTTNEQAVADLVAGLDAVCVTRAPESRDAWERLLTAEANRQGVPVGAFDASGKETTGLDLAVLHPTALRPRKRFKQVAIPDYCLTNVCSVVARLNMAEALERAGFVAWALPFTADDGIVAEAMSGADALMVAGGWKGQDYPKRCAFEDRVIREALRLKLPISGICHGMQVVNKSLGGTLDETFQKKKEKDFLIAHRMPVRTPYTDNFHLADLTPGSRIAKVLGSHRAVINSSHSCCVGRVAEGLKVTARAQDGIVEAYEHETLPIMAFQFHPERMTYDARFVELIRVALSRR